MSECEHHLRKCAWCNTHTRQHIAHKNDARPFYIFCDNCLTKYLSKLQTGVVDSGDSGLEGTKMKCSKCGVFTGGDYFLMPDGTCRCQTCHDTLTAAEAVKKPMVPQSKGEVRRLPKANSPMFTEQWSVQGSAKLPYIVSRKTHADGSTTTERFCCACPAFTQKKAAMREDCKHILKVKLFEGMSLAAADAGVAPAHAKEYAEWLRLKAKEKRAAAVSNPSDMQMEGDDMGRKFR